MYRYLRQRTAHHRIHLIVGLILSNGMWSAALAQGVATAGIRGTVTRTGGAPVNGAAIVLTQPSTGAESRGFSSEDGRYFIGNLRPGGPYLIRVSHLGLRAVEQAGVHLSVGEVRRFDFELPDEALQLEGLEVSVALDPVFTGARAGTEMTLGAEVLTRMPTLSRNLVDFSSASPLVRVTEGAISIAGQNHRYNAIVVDGALSQDHFGHSRTGIAGGQANAKLIPLEAVEQYQLQVAPYDVRLSGFTGGLLNFVTRSGTNEWSGSLFGTARDRHLMGDVVVDGVAARPGTLNRRVAGFTVGGPLIRDRLHLFLAGEAEWVRQGTGGYSHGVIAPIRTALTADSVARLQAILREGHGLDAGTAEQYQVGNPSENLFIRVDFLARPGQRVVLRHNLALAERDIAANREPVAEYGLSSNGYRHRSASHTSTLQWYAELGGRYSNEALLNFHRIRDRGELNSGFPLLDIDIRSDFDGSMLFRRVRAGADPFAQAADLDQDAWQFTNNLTGRFGRHLVTAGLAAESIRVRREGLVGALGSYRFSSLAALEENRPDHYQRQLLLPGADAATTSFTMRRLGAYLQDEWSPRNELLLQAGVRMDVPGFQDRPGRNVAIEEAFGRSTASLPSGAPLFSPRLGFNWKPGGAAPTQIRGGVGIFAGTLPLAWVADAFLNNGLRSAFLVCEGANAPGFEQAPPETCRDGRGAETGLTPSVILFDPEFRFPRELRTSIALDRALPFGFVGTVEWLYTRALDQVRLRELNLAGAVEDPTHKAGYSQILGERGFFGTPTTTGFRPRRISDEFAQVILVTNGATNYSYSIGFELQRNLSERLLLRTGYSFSRSGDTQSLLSASAIENLALNPSLAGPNATQLAPSDFDRPHKVTASATALLPLSWGGGELTLYYAGQSGKPYTYVYLNDVNGDGYPGLGAALNGTNDPVHFPFSSDSGHTELATRFLIEDLAALEPCVKDFQGTTLPRNHCRAPWAGRLDLRMQQPLRVAGLAVELSGDLVNVLNLLNRQWGHQYEVRPLVPVLMMTGRSAGGLNGPQPQDAAEVSYVGPTRHIPGLRRPAASKPHIATFPASQWQAQLGVRLQF